MLGGFEMKSTSLSDKERKFLACHPRFESELKEAIKKIEFRLLKKYKMASVSIMEIIKEEFGAELCSEEKGFIKEWAEDDVWDKEENLK